MKNIYARFRGIKSFLHFQRPRTFLSGNARSYFLFSSRCYSFIACKPVFQILSTRRTGFQEFFGTLGHANNNLLCEIKKSFFDTLNILCSRSRAYFSILPWIHFSIHLFFLPLLPSFVDHLDQFSSSYSTLYFLGEKLLLKSIGKFQTLLLDLNSEERGGKMISSTDSGRSIGKKEKRAIFNRPNPLSRCGNLFSISCTIDGALDSECSVYQWARD